jgi:hypothetical protein
VIVGEVAVATFILAVLLAGVTIGRWLAGQSAMRVMGERVTALEREVERLSALATQHGGEIARIDSTAVLWHGPEMRMPDSPHGITP